MSMYQLKRTIFIGSCQVGFVFHILDANFHFIPGPWYYLVRNLLCAVTIVKADMSRDSGSAAYCIIMCLTWAMVTSGLAPADLTPVSTTWPPPATNQCYPISFIPNNYLVELGSWWVIYTGRTGLAGSDSLYFLDKFKY